MLPAPAGESLWHGNAMNLTIMNQYQSLEREVNIFLHYLRVPINLPGDDHGMPQARPGVLAPNSTSL